MKPLTKKMTESGKRFVELLIENGSTPKAAFWIYNPEADSWILLLGHVNGIDDDDAKFNGLVTTIHGANRLELPELEVGDIGLAQAQAPILELLNSVVNTGDDTLGINFSQEEINGTVIDGVFLYRMNI